MDSQVEEIKAKTDIVELIGQSVKLTRAGRNFKGLCPFHHERTPSFMVSPERGTWRCFGCGEFGDAITYLEKYENLTFIEALEQLAQKAGIELKRQKQDPQQHSRQQKLYQLLQLAADYYHYLLMEHQQ
jgi:DNA primase